MQQGHDPYAALYSLLELKEFGACRNLTERYIAEHMASSEPGAWDALARLHLVLARAMIGQGEHAQAGEKADLSAFLARKLGVNDLHGEALYWAGYAYMSAGDFAKAADRFTAYLEGGEQARRGEALYSRGLAYQSMGAYSHAIPDYEAAARWAAEHRSPWLHMCRANLAWVLILQKEYARAESLLVELESAADSGGDPLLRLQIQHDRAHMRALQGRHPEAITHCLAVLQEAGRDYPFVRAHVAMTLMQVAAGVDQPAHGFILGMLAKRLAGQAGRPDLDEEASRRIEVLEYAAGSECLTDALLNVRQVLPGVLPRNRQRSRNKPGGATDGSPTD